MPSKKPLIAVRLSKEVHADLMACCAAEGRTPANFIEFHMGPMLQRMKHVTAQDTLLSHGVHPRQAKVEKHLGRPFPRQMRLEDAIAEVVKRGPVKTARGAKHK